METTKPNTSILSAIPTAEQMAQWDALSSKEQKQLMDQAIQEARESEPIRLPLDELEARSRKNARTRLTNQ